MQKDSLFPTSSQAFIICRFFDDSHQSVAPWVAHLVKNPPTMQEMKADVGSIPKLRRSPAGGHGNWLQYSYLENPMERGAWRATVHRAAKSRTQLKRMSTHTHTSQNSHHQKAISFWHITKTRKGELLSNKARKNYLSSFPKSSKTLISHVNKRKWKELRSLFIWNSDKIENKEQNNIPLGTETTLERYVHR